MHKAIYVPPGRAVEVRDDIIVPIWVRLKDKRVRGYVKAQAGWVMGPPAVTETK